jgi:hypothetical protein
MASSLIAHRLLYAILPQKTIVFKQIMRAAAQKMSLRLQQKNAPSQERTDYLS